MGLAYGLKKACGIVVAAVLVTGIMGCGKGGSLPDMLSMGTINAIAREDGSGTKNEFYRLIGLSDETQSGGVDNIAQSTDDMCNMISGDKNSIGYVAYDSIMDKSDIKVLSVDGKKPDNDTIRFNQYPLIRNYYIAYQGEPEGLMQDFIRYIMSAGQEIMGKSCVAVNDSAVFLSDKSSGKITIGGSSSVAPIMKELINDYKKYNPDAEIELVVSDSSDGLNRTINGELDMAISSRELKDYENTLLNKKAIGKDAIAVIVNADNPADNLTKAQLKKIYGGKADTWQGL